MAEILLSSSHPPLGTWQRSSSPLPSPTECHSPTAYMAEILHSSPIPHWVHQPLSVPHCVHGRDPPLLPIPHWVHVSVSVPHCVHGRDPPFLSHPPLGTCVTECPPLGTWQRSSSPPHPPLGTCVSERPHCVHGRDPPLLLPHPPLSPTTSVLPTECPPLRTWQRSSSPPHPPLGT